MSHIREVYLTSNNVSVDSMDAHVYEDVGNTPNQNFYTIFNSGKKKERKDPVSRKPARKQTPRRLQRWKPAPRIICSTGGKAVAIAGSILLLFIIIGASSFLVYYFTRPNKQDSVMQTDPIVVKHVGNTPWIDWHHNWAYGCDFGKTPLKDMLSRGDQCGPFCERTPGCTHFTWNPNVNGGTCFMKTGGASKEDAVIHPDVSIVCGLALNQLQG